MILDSRSRRCFKEPEAGPEDRRAGKRRDGRSRRCFKEPEADRPGKQTQRPPLGRSRRCFKEPEADRADLMGKLVRLPQSPLFQRA